MVEPVIVLAFANDRDNHLPMLSQESRNIFRILRDYDDKDFIRVYKEESTSIEDVFDLFIHYLDRIVIFHYGGHAGGTHLQLETAAGDSRLAYSIGLAQLMGQQKGLQLVFLNGCATKGQVDLLLSAGVKAVIATSVAINDDMAVEFAEKFYTTLAEQATVQKAFEIAKAFISTKYGTSREINIFRNVRWEGEQTSVPCPWGLYLNESNQAVLDWELPTIRRYYITTSDVPAKVEVNTELIKTLFKEVEKYLGEDWARQFYKENSDLDFRLACQGIIDSFPMPVGEKLRQIFVPGAKVNPERLQQLVIAYNTIVELLCFIMLSQLWDVKFTKPEAVISDKYFIELLSFLVLDERNYRTFNYLKLVEAIAGIFKENNIKCFMQELNELEKCVPDKEGEFYKAHLFLEEMKGELSGNKVQPDEIESFCVQAEEHLGTILSRLAFFVKYKLATIKSIEVIRRKQEKPKYRHNKVMLDKVTAGVWDDESTYDSFTDNNSVILLKNTKNVKEYVSLSPFIIDENALTNVENSKLFFYSYQEIKDGNNFYNYTFVNNEKEKLIVSDENFSQIKKQFEDFKEDVLK